MQQFLSQRIAKVQPSFIREILKVAGQPGVISFAGGLPKQSLFPLEAIQAAARAVLEKEGRAALQYSITEGHSELRAWIAERYRQRFGLNIPVEEILITNGSQQALDLLGKVLIDPGDEIIIEAPGYLGALQAFSLYRPHWLPVPLHEAGIDVEALQRALRGHRPKLIYSVPNFQNPSGISYSPENRGDVADLLQQQPILLIEDDPYGELRFQGKPAPSFRELLPQQSILLGSFSKTVLPSFRVGWIVAPPWLMEKLVIAKQSADLHTGGFIQQVIYRYLRDHDFDMHLKRIIEVYGRQKQAMTDAIRQHFAADIRTTNPQGGMFLWATLPKHLSATDLFEAAIKRKVAFVPGAPFYIDKTDSNDLRLNFTNADEDTIRIGIQRLGTVIEESIG